MLARLRNERHGMILVVAIPMAAILVGALWYVAAVGDAVLFRERLQDAADATAFESAVIHARGMNAVAMLNMVMAMLLCIVVVIRAVELILAVGLVFFGLTAGPLSTVINIDLQWSDRIGRLVAILSKVEKGVAAATPALSTVMASAHNTSFYRTQQAATGTIGFSHALMPAKVDSYLKVSAGEPWLLTSGRQDGGPRLATALGSGGGAMEILPSLPLEEDSYDRVCAEAIAFLPTQISGMASRLGMPGAVTWAFNKAVDRVSGTIQEYTKGIFCGSPSGWVTDKIADAAGSYCDGELPADAQTQEEVEEEYGDAGPPLPRRPSGESGSADRPQRTTQGSSRRAGQGVDDCEAEVKEKMKKGAADPDEQRPAKLWTPVKNGNVLLQTWSVAVRAEPRFKREDERGMEVMAKDKDANIVADPLTWAEAEYYFDCSANGNDWGACKPNTLWALGWTARMRRFWWPLKQLAGAGDTYQRFIAVFGDLNNLVRNGLGDFGNGLVHDVGQGFSTGIMTRELVHSMNRTNVEWIH